MAERVTSDNFSEKVLAAKLPVLVDFYSDSCVPCKRMSGVIAQIEEEYTGKVAVYKVNSNFEGELLTIYKIMSAPTFVIFKNGQEVARLAGVQKKETIVEKIMR